MSMYAQEYEHVMDKLTTSANTFFNFATHMKKAASELVDDMQERKK